MSAGPVPAGPADVAALADLHASAFDPPWTTKDIAPLFLAPGALALWEPDRGFILCWRHGEEAEVLTVAVRPDRRRQGAGERLMLAAMDRVAAHGARVMLLEVAADNEPALRLYQRLGFMALSRRKGYYARGQARVDAIVMRADLSPRLDTGRASPHIES